MGTQSFPTQAVPPQIQPHQQTVITHPNQSQTGTTPPEQPLTSEATVVPDNNSHKSWKKVIMGLIILVVSLVIIGLGSIIIFPQIIPVLAIKTQFTSEQLNNISVKPKNKTYPNAPNQSQMQTYTLNNLTFQSNWKLEKELLSKDGQSHIFKFEMNKTILAMQQPKFSELAMQMSPLDKYDQLRKVFPASEYEFFNRIMQASGSNVKLSDNLETVKINSVYLVLKKAILLGEKVEIYSFTLNNVRGFEIHSLDTKNYHVYLFDQNNNIYNLSFVGNNITQQDVDSIVTTIAIN